MGSTAVVSGGFENGNTTVAGNIYVTDMGNGMEQECGGATSVKNIHVSSIECTYFAQKIEC